MCIAYIPFPVTSAIKSHKARALKRCFDSCRMDHLRYSPPAASSPKKPSGTRPRTWKPLSKALNPTVRQLSNLSLSRPRLHKYLYMYIRHSSFYSRPLLPRSGGLRPSSGAICACLPFTCVPLFCKRRCSEKINCIPRRNVIRLLNPLLNCFGAVFGC